MPGSYPDESLLGSTIDVFGANWSLKFDISDTGCYFGFVSSKQPVVAKSVGEVELIAHNKVGDLVE